MQYECTGQEDVKKYGCLPVEIPEGNVKGQKHSWALNRLHWLLNPLLPIQVPNLHYRPKTQNLFVMFLFIAKPNLDSIPLYFYYKNTMLDI